MNDGNTSDDDTTLCGLAVEEIPIGRVILFDLTTGLVTVRRIEREPAQDRPEPDYVPTGEAVLVG